MGAHKLTSYKKGVSTTEEPSYNIGVPGIPTDHVPLITCRFHPHPRISVLSPHQPASSKRRGYNLLSILESRVNTDEYFIFGGGKLQINGILERQGY